MSNWEHGKPGCDECYWGVHYTGGNVQCRRHAPIYHTDHSGSGIRGTSESHRFPVVAAYDWCGDWQSNAGANREP